MSARAKRPALPRGAKPAAAAARGPGGRPAKNSWNERRATAVRDIKFPVQVAAAPRPVGPYSQAQVVNLPGGARMVFTAGQVALDPASGEMRGEGVAEQTEQVMNNLSAVLAGAGLALEDVIKTTVYLADMKDFQEMNQVYARFFPGSPPARTTIAAAGLPRGARVEIDTVAVGRGR